MAISICIPARTADTPPGGGQADTPAGAIVPMGINRSPPFKGEPRDIVCSYNDAHRPRQKLYLEPCNGFLNHFWIQVQVAVSGPKRPLPYVPVSEAKRLQIYTGYMHHNVHYPTGKFSVRVTVMYHKPWPLAKAYGFSRLTGLSRFTHQQDFPKWASPIWVLPW
jgi:hypothetical protein